MPAIRTRAALTLCEIFTELERTRVDPLERTALDQTEQLTLMHLDHSLKAAKRACAKYAGFNPLVVGFEVVKAIRKKRMPLLRLSELPGDFKEPDVGVLKTIAYLTAVFCVNDKSICNNSKIQDYLMNHDLKSVFTDNGNLVFLPKESPDEEKLSEELEGLIKQLQDEKTTTQVSPTFRGTPTDVEGKDKSSFRHPVFRSAPGQLFLGNCFYKVVMPGKRPVEVSSVTGVSFFNSKKRCRAICNSIARKASQEGYLAPLSQLSSGEFGSVVVRVEEVAKEIVASKDILRLYS